MKTKTLMLTLTSAAVLFYALGTLPASAQLAVPPLAPVYQPLSDQQLDQLLGPIALYPDPLLGEILPAATFPTQIVLANRYLSGGGDPNQMDQQPWDASVLAVAHYPAVLKYMDDNLAWTTALGQAFLYQQQQVIESIQRLRLSAQNYGNLVSTPQEQVVNDNGCVEILPANPDVIYVPVYQTQYVYCQSGFGLGFSFGCSIGPWLNCDFDWVHHDLRHWGHNHQRPANWWHERPDQRQAAIASQTTNWHPEGHHNSGVPSHTDHGWNNHVPSSSPAPAQPQNQATPTHDRQQQFQQPPQQRAQQFQQRNINIPSPQQPGQPFHPGANNGIFGANDNSRDVRTFSGRGEQSVGNVTHSDPVQPRSEPPQIRNQPAPPPHIEAASPAPSPRSAPAAQTSSNGGGGGNGGNGGNGGSGGGGEGSRGSSRR